MALTKKTPEEREALKKAAKEFKEKSVANVETPTSYNLRDVSTSEKKGLIFGPSGSGKTITAIAGALLAGKRVFALSTDFGGQGLTSVVEYLRDLVTAGKLPQVGFDDILDNRLKGITLSTFEQVTKFLVSPEIVVPGLAEFDPHLDVWDGYSYYQQTMVDKHAWSEYPDEAQSYPRWGEVLRVTMQQLGEFIALKHTDVLPHKIVTALEDKADVDDITKKITVGPMINTKAKSLAGGGFDLVVNTFREDGKFKYRSVGDSEKYAVKSRGIRIPPIMNADPLKLWQALTGEIDFREEK